MSDRPARLDGVALMRELVLLGAACTVAEPADAPPAEGWTAHPERRAEIAAAMAELSAGDDPLLGRLRDGLGLSTEACWLVLLCAAVELYPDAAAAASILAEDRRIQLPTPTTFVRLMRAIGDVPTAELLAVAIEGGDARMLGLLEVTEPVAGQPRAQHALRLVGTELRTLLREPHRLGTRRELEAPSFPPARDTAFDRVRAEGAATLLAASGVLVLRSASRRASIQFGYDIASVRELPLVVVTVEDELPRVEVLPRGRPSPESGGGQVVVDLWGWTANRAFPAAWVRAAEAVVGTVLVIVAETCATGSFRALDVGRLGYPEASRIWRMILPDPEAAHWLATRYRVSADEVIRAVQEARDVARVERGETGPATPAAIGERIRAQGARRISRQAAVLAPGGSLDALVVTPAVRRQLHELIAAHAASWRVYEQMGLALKNPLGRGITCLFSGKPGTGKSFAARCIAAELGLNLYRVDLAQVVSKYIGETEKALAAVFDEADAGHGILLFDEADALFGKRSEVKDAHDRYANIEVGYLLQRLESFDGVAILTTNLAGNMDGAFVRRLRFVIDFPLPDRSLRRRLWEQALPPEAWREHNLDLELFADRIAIPGGNIHNIGLAAAHLAAATPSGRISNGHLVRATLLELEKTGRPASPAMLGPLAGLATEVAS